jgi:hypothetical protein
MALSYYGASFYATNYFASRFYNPEEAEEHFIEKTGGASGLNPLLRREWFRENVIVDEYIDEQDLTDIITIVLASGILDE